MKAVLVAFVTALLLLAALASALASGAAGVLYMVTLPVVAADPGCLVAIFRVGGWGNHDNGSMDAKAGSR